MKQGPEPQLWFHTLCTELPVSAPHQDQDPPHRLQLSPVCAASPGSPRPRGGKAA